MHGAAAGRRALRLSDRASDHPTDLRPDLRIDPPFLLSPMAGVTSTWLRALCEELGAGLTLCEFVSSEALVADGARARARIRSTGAPLAVQIFGRDPARMAEAARTVVDRGAALVDINMGCPAKRVVGGLAGAALMQEPHRAAAIVAAVRRAVPDRVPVSVKMRAGDRADRRNAPELARCLVDVGAAMITVHGRTRAQAFRGAADRTIIRQTCAAVQVPVIGNGDVATVQDALAMMVETGCAGVMIGRAGARDPWLFHRLHAIWTGAADPGPADRATRAALVGRAVALGEVFSGPTVARQVARLASDLAHGLPGARAFRTRVVARRDLAAVAADAAAYFAGANAPTAVVPTG